MGNAFDIPDGEPAALVAGDLWQWERADLAEEYPPAEFTLSYVLTEEAETDPAQVTFAANAEPGRFVVRQIATADHKPAAYRWAASITRGADGARKLVDTGRLEVRPDPAGAPVDPRTEAARNLAMIEAVIADRSAKDVQSYSIEGRSLVRMTVDDLMRLRDFWARKVQRERGEVSPSGMRHVPVVLR